MGGDRKNVLPRRGAGPGRDPGPDLEKNNGGHGSQNLAPVHEMPEGGSLPAAVEDGEVGPAPQGRPIGELAVDIPADMPAGRDRHAPGKSRRRPSGTTHVRADAGLVR